MNRIIQYIQPRIANRSPWTGLESEVDRLFQSALADFPTRTFAPRFPVDLYEDKDNTYVRAELPGVARDAINVEKNSHHIWIDHVDISDGSDGNLDVTNQSNYVTVSWSRFWYRDPNRAHRFSTLIGSSDTQTGDTGMLKVTMHHNWWAEGVTERMPRVRFGDVHLLNNYYSSAGNNYAVRAAYNSRVLVEGNYFDTVNDPHEINNDDGGPAQVLALDNIYSQTSGATNATGTAFVPGYEYSVTPTIDVATLVTAQAGPR